MPHEPWRKWKHITKLDPDRKICADVIRQIVDTETDAIMISGTQNINKSNVKQLIDLLKEYDIPKVLEPAHPACLTYKHIDYIFVPSVFNTDRALWINGLHKKWVKEDKNIDWDIVVPEAYIILNPKCAAAKVSGAKVLDKEDAVAAAVCAERFFKFPIIYIEYSGVYGDVEVVKAIKESLTTAHLIYGGGINTRKKAEEMSMYATIVVGNTIYEKGTDSFADTMYGTLSQQMSVLKQKLKKIKEMKRKKQK